MSQSPSAADRAYNFVKERILTGSLAGSLSEGEVARELDISRTPVHEAFLRLQAEGHIRLYPKRGAFIAPVSRDEIRDVFSARQLIEAAAASAICAQPRKERVELCERLDALIAQQEKALDQGDIAAYALLDAEFHQCILDHGGNAILAGWGQSLRERQQRYNQQAAARAVGTARGFVDHHARLAAALRYGSVEAYHEVLGQHLKAALAQL